MRFDDKLATVLAQPRGDAAARAVAWRQIVDILAQAPPGTADPLSAEATALLRALRAEVPQAVRAEAVAALAGRRVHACVVALVAEERPSVAGLLIGHTQLADGEWLFLLPRLSITARALLRHRRDLSPMVRAGLASFGASDFALPPAGAMADDAPEREDETMRRSGEGDARAVPADATDALVAVPPAMDDAAMPDIVGLFSKVEVAGQASPACDRARGGAGMVAAVPEPVSPALDGGRSTAPAGNGAGAAVLPFAPRSSPALVVGDTPITDMLARIAAYKRDDAPAAPPPPATAFRFETGVDGVILWVEGAPRAALIGLGIATAATAATHGVDGQAAGAFRHRAPFRDARLTIEGGAAAGEWRIAGVPVFDAHDGRFTGYRGTGRRPRLDEQAAPATAGLYGTGLPADALRQLVHELRTPLNAIVGFGEMIEGQLLGPATAAYRGQANTIVGEGRRLLEVVDDLDTAARAEADALDARPEPITPATLLHRLTRDYRPVAAARGALLDVVIAEPGGTVTADAVMVERMIARLLAAAIGVAQPGETIACHLSSVHDTLLLHLTRPALLAGRAEAMLLDPGFSPEGDFPDAPLLGLGFALRLVRTLATAVGGTLEIGGDRFALRLPMAAAVAADGTLPG